MMIKGFKIRLYPTKEQENKMWQHVGASRFIWNYMIEYQETNYKNGGRYLDAYNMGDLIAPLKQQEEYKWLNDISFYSLMTVCRNLNISYKQFFKGTWRHPKYKSKKTAKHSFSVRGNRLHFEDKFVHVEKIGDIKYKTDFILPKGTGNHFLCPYIKYELGKWMLCLCIEGENQTPQLTNKSMGIDLGIKEQAVVAFGEDEIRFHNINKSKKMRKLFKQLKHVERVLNRKYRAVYKRTGTYIKTNNIIKQEDKLRKIHKKISNIRKNYIHQITHQLVSLYPYRVVMEDLNVKGMMKNKHLAKAINEQNFFEFMRQMQYKCEWNGIVFIKADRWFPSSKLCNCCGTIKQNLKLSDRVYKCECGFQADRDFNAALNLSKYIA